MRENNFNIDGLRFRSSKERKIFTEISNAGAEGSPAGPAGCASESLKAGRGTWTRRSLVSCLLGSLLLALAMLVAPAKSPASVGIFVSFGPPAIPVYVQPACPAPGYMWTPGYWAWDPDYGYYWVPGTWVPAPFVGAMWTPGYWGWYNDGYVWYPGYWGTEVGFYGGIDYGYGYTGRGYYGGQWRGDRFFYNRKVNHITNVNIVNVYNQRVVVNNNGPRISYNGGRGGIDARPTSAEMAAERSRRSGAVNQQLEQERFARNDPAQRARENHGRPQVAATARPGEFRGSGVVRATRAGAPYKEPPREVRGGREPGRTTPAPVERAPSRNGPREAAPNQRMERSAPQQAPTNQRMERSAPPPQRNERQVNRNNRPPEVQRNQRESRPPQARPNESRGAQERQAHPNEGRHEGRNDKNPPHSQR
jgi:WXXGXW repeat (2 copies)